MVCTKCGASLREGAAFCTNCGTKVLARSQAASAPSQNTNGQSHQSLKEVRGKYWHQGSPLAVCGWSVLSAPGKQGVNLVLNIENLTEKAINAIYFSVKGYNVLKEEKCDLKEVIFLDLNIGGYAKADVGPYLLPDETIRNLKIGLKNVVFADESIWYNQTGNTELINIQQEMKRIPVQYEKGVWELQKNLYPSKPAHITYIFYPVKGENYWYCGCGRFNVGDACSNCRIQKELAFKMLTEENCIGSQREYDEQMRIKEEEKRARAEEERRQREAAAEAERARIQAERERRAEKRKESIESFQNSAKGLWSTIGNKTNQIADNVKNAVNETSEKLASKKEPAAQTEGYKFCRFCGTKLEKDAVFCIECGERQ